MLLDFAQLSALEAYRWLAATVTPRPIAWVSTRSPEGVAFREKHETQTPVQSQAEERAVQEQGIGRA